MNVLTRYMVFEILKGSVCSVVILLTLFNLFTFSDELADIGKGSYDLTTVFYYVALTSPRVFYELMPASALLGSLFILGAMGNQHELIAMRAAGLSVAKIIQASLLAGLILVGIAIGVGEFVAPKAEQQAQILKATAQNDSMIRHARYGLWLRDDKTFINIRRLQSNGELADISIYELNEQRTVRQVEHAERATFLGKQRWLLQNLQQSELTAQSVQASSQAQREWSSTIVPDLLKIVVVNPNNLSLLDLAKYIQFLKDNQQKSQSFELAFWGRVVNPLIIFVMLLVSAPFVIGIQRGVSSGARILLGIVIGMSFNIIDRIVGHLGLIYEWNPALTAVLPSACVLVFAALAMRRVL